MTVDDLSVLLSAREAELSAIYENVPGILFYIAVEADGEFRFVSVSHDFLIATGLSRQQVVGSLVRDVIPQPSRDMVLKHYREAIRSGQPVRWEEESVYPAGRRYGEVAVTPLYDASCFATHLIGIVHDITERKRAEEALLRAEKIASLGRMAATIAHEINNPLEGATNALYLAKGTEGLPESAREYIEIADSELDRVAHIARQSLGFYRESNAPSAVSITMVLASVLGLLRNRIQAKNATIKNHWEDNVYLTAVGGELRQVFSNLLNNSLDAIERNGTIMLRVSAAVTHKSQRCVRVTISDNGKGVDANLRSQIFEPFFTTKGIAGTGLGLWVSKQIVDNHGGTIRVRSNTHGPRRGTTVSVLLPNTQSRIAGLGATRSAEGSDYRRPVRR